MNEELKKILGDTILGPALFYERGEFIICFLSVKNPEPVGSGKTIEEAIESWRQGNDN